MAPFCGFSELFFLRPDLKSSLAKSLKPDQGKDRIIVCVRVSMVMVRYRVWLVLAYNCLGLSSGLEQTSF